jgi:AcrR family transcriptional regulator
VTFGTRERILDGAAVAVARHGLAKLDMGDVSLTSGVSRGTLYRYFPGRDVLLAELAQREGVRFKQRMLEAIGAAPPGPERIRVALEHATRHVQEHPALQRLLETDPAFVLRALRREFPTIRAELGQVLGPILGELDLVRHRVVGTGQLVDWTVRLMISAFLVPEADADDMAHGLAAVCRLLVADQRPPVPPRRAARLRGRASATSRRR